MPPQDDERDRQSLESLTDTVKSRILQRIIEDLRDDLAPNGNRITAYTKSDSGIYGKYQKADFVDVETVLGAVKVQLEQLLADYRIDDNASRPLDQPDTKK